MRRRSNCCISSCARSRRHGKCRHANGARPSLNSLSCSTIGSSKHDGWSGPAHKIPDSSPFASVKNALEQDATVVMAPVHWQNRCATLRAVIQPSCKPFRRHPDDRDDLGVHSIWRLGARGPRPNRPALRRLQARGWMNHPGAIIEQRGPIKLITPFSLRSGSPHARVSAHRRARVADSVAPAYAPLAPP